MSASYECHCAGRWLFNLYPQLLHSTYISLRSGILRRCLLSYRSSHHQIVSPNINIRYFGIIHTTQRHTGRIFWPSIHISSKKNIRRRDMLKFLVYRVRFHPAYPYFANSSSHFCLPLRNTKISVICRAIRGSTQAYLTHIQGGLC